MRMPVLKIALTGLASLALGSAAYGADVFNAGADVLYAGADVLYAGADVFNGRYNDQYYYNPYYYNPYYYNPYYNNQYYNNQPYSDQPNNDQSSNDSDDRNYPTAAVCRTQHLPWRHGSYSVHVCYGNGPAALKPHFINSLTRSGRKMAHFQ